ncbi:MAG: hypothetical protein PHT88_04310 [Candidatus Moranbacteria bacterium]|nr:hypothetical protein [Candidatus Moranbacteria bacterium]
MNTLTVATVNVSDVKLVRQEGKALTVAFSISNREGVQPKVIYAVNLVQKDGSGQDITVDRKVYDDVLSIGTNDVAHKEITYVAPDYLQGTYFIKVEARNPEGLIFGMSQIPNAITFSGTGEYIRINPTACFLTVDGENKNTHYALAQGVDISQDETLTAHCPLQSAFSTAQTITPFFVSRYRSAFGKVVHNDALEPLTMQPGQSLDFAVKLPRLTEPQAYESTLTFVDSESKAVSSSIDFHYVLRGESATIQNIILDKDGYMENGTALVTFVWSGSADRFLGSRIGSNGADKEISAIITLSDDEKNPCAESLTHTLDVNRTGGKESISLPITRNCRNPVVSAKIVDQDGRMLAESTYDIRSEDTFPTDAATLDASMLKKSVWIAVVYAIAFLLIMTLLVYLMRRHKRSGMMVLLGFMISAGVLLGGAEVRADTFFVAKTGGEDTLFTTFTANLDQALYEPGGNITASGTYAFSVCSNGQEATPFITVTLTATINGVTKDILNKSADFTAQNVRGIYSSIIDASAKFEDEDEDAGTGGILIPYAVAASSGTDGVCGTANGKVYAESQSGYGADTQCAVGNSTNPAFPAVGGVASWICRGSGGGSDEACSATRDRPLVLKICPANPLPQLTINQGESRMLELDYDARTDCFDTSSIAIPVPATSWGKVDTNNVIASLNPSNGAKNALVTAAVDGILASRTATIKATYMTETADVVVTVVSIPQPCICDPATLDNTCDTDTFTAYTPVGTCVPQVCTGRKSCRLLWKEVPPAN